MEHTDCSINEDDSFIEIKLDASATCSNDDDDDKTNIKESNCEDDDVDGEREEYQLRISISSSISVSLPDVQKECTNVQGTVPTESQCNSSMMTCSFDDTETYAEDSSVGQTDESRVEVEISVQNRSLNSVSSNPRVLRESPQSDGQTTILRATQIIPYDNLDLLYARKQPNLTPKSHGGMMKLLIKCRGIKIGALLASLIKSQQPCQTNKGNKSSKKFKAFFQCYQKILVKNPSNGRRGTTTKRDQGRRSKHWDMEDDHSMCDSFRSSSKKSSGVMEMDLGAVRVRGILNAMGISVAQKGGSRSKRRTQSSSCEVSPIHEGLSLCSSENSIQAAIAYCKSSLGQTSDFSFCSSSRSSPL